MPLAAETKLNVGDVVAFHGTVEYVIPPSNDDDHARYKVRVHDAILAPIYVKADGIAAIVRRKPEPGSPAKIISGMRTGSVVTVLSATDEWAMVTIGDGYIPFVVGIDELEIA